MVEVFEESLQPDDLANITYGQSDKKFKLGDGRVFQAMAKVKLPTYLGEKKVLNETEIN